MRKLKSNPTFNDNESKTSRFNNKLEENKHTNQETQQISMPLSKWQQILAAQQEMQLSVQTLEQKNQELLQSNQQLAQTNQNQQLEMQNMQEKIEKLNGSDIILKRNNELEKQIKDVLQEQETTVQACNKQLEDMEQTVKSQQKEINQQWQSINHEQKKLEENNKQFKKKVDKEALDKFKTYQTQEIANIMGIILIMFTPIFILFGQHDWFRSDTIQLFHYEGQLIGGFWNWAVDIVLSIWHWQWTWGTILGFPLVRWIAIVLATVIWVIIFIIILLSIIFGIPSLFIVAIIFALIGYKVPEDKRHIDSLWLILCLLSFLAISGWIKGLIGYFTHIDLNLWLILAIGLIMGNIIRFIKYHT